MRLILGTPWNFGLETAVCPRYSSRFPSRRGPIEARLEGIHPFCIAIDEQGPDYLPPMCGAANFTVVADVSRLPAKVSGIYRWLASRGARRQLRVVLAEPPGRVPSRRCQRKRQSADAVQSGS